MWQPRQLDQMDLKFDDLIIRYSLQLNCVEPEKCQVLIHNARAFPDVSERGFSISPGFETFVGLEPYSSYTTPDVDRLPIDKRKCYNDFENPLKFYANYSSSRCMMECLTRKMIDWCGCRPYYYVGTVHRLRIELHYSNKFKIQSFDVCATSKNRTPGETT